MKYYITFLVLFITCIYSQHESDLKLIRSRYYEIKEFEYRLDYKILNDMENSSQGGEIKFFFNQKNEISIIKTHYFGEMGQVQYEFYFHNEILFFVFKKDENYNSHLFTMGADPEKLKKEFEDENIEPFDPKKSKFEENRFYFSQNKLIKWLNNEKKDETPNSENWPENQMFLITESKTLLKKCKKAL